MGTDNVVLGRRYIGEIWSKGNLDVISEIMSSNVVIHDPLAKEVRGIEDLKKHVRELRAAFPDLNLSIEDAYSVDGRAVLSWVARGTHRGALLGIPGTNRSGSIKGVDMIRVENGKIAEVTAYWDAYNMFQQLGLVPALDQLSRGTGVSQQPTMPR